jgi:selenocysteine lyase/cysteine desulfurase
MLFTPGTTFGIIWLQTDYPILKPGDEVLISMEHHSNIVPWQMLL